MVRGMARPLRVEFAGAVYHAMARGNERKAIFRDDRDRRRFLETLAEMVERFGVRLHAYCLMTNHYHLVLETPRANLTQALGWLQLTYTVRFNRRHRRSGHLFQGRFKAQLVAAAEYAQSLVEYVHLNPVRSGTRNQPLAPERAVELEQYRWSSQRVYAGLERQAPEWLCQEWLRYWGSPPAAAHAEYRRSIQRWFAGQKPNPWEQLVGGLVLGGETLLAQAQARLARKGTGEEARWVQRRIEPGLRQRLEQKLAAEPDERLKIWARVRLGGERSVAVARTGQYASGSGVGNVVRRLEQRSRRDRPLRQKMAALKAHLCSVQS
jgi:putative transposase